MLGAEVVITGMRPEIAKELANLDIRMDGIVLRRSLQSGISYAETLASDLEKVITQKVPLSGSASVFDMIADPGVNAVKVLLDCQA